MPAITVSVANVSACSSAAVREVFAGGPVTHITPVYRSPTTGKYLGCTNDATEDEANVVGVSITAGQDGSKLFIATSGVINVGSGVSDGAMYFLGRNGDIVPEGDLVTGDRKVLIGSGRGTDKLFINILQVGIVP